MKLAESDVVCLLGNGVSIAYNPSLSVASLTTDLMAKFRDAGASEPEQALASFAHTVASSAHDQFEQLLGPLSTTALGLASLQSLAPIVAGTRVEQSLHETSEFLSTVHRIGVAITLGHIAERSIGSDSDSRSVVETLGTALGKLIPASKLSVATLNYDGLTHAALFDAWSDVWGLPQGYICDLAHGAFEQDVDVTPQITLPAHGIRRFDDLMLGRAAVLQLHGSLGWLRDSAGDVWKFKLQDLRDANYWQALREDNVLVTPTVVLTDRKTAAVGEWPFALAYEAFMSRLLRASSWLIAGYSFGDEPVNRMLKTAMHLRRDRDKVNTNVLVLDKSADSESTSRKAAQALGVAPGALLVDVQGLPESIGSTAWEEWRESL
jgi:hypothetical protein